MLEFRRVNGLILCGGNCGDGVLARDEKLYKNLPALAPVLDAVGGGVLDAVQPYVIALSL